VSPVSLFGLFELLERLRLGADFLVTGVRVVEETFPTSFPLTPTFR